MGRNDSIGRRLDQLELAAQRAATVVRQADGSIVYVPRFALADCFFSFLNLASDGAFVTDAGESVPDCWVQALANSAPEVDEGEMMAAVRAWCQQRIAGKPLAGLEPPEPGAE